MGDEHRAQRWLKRAGWVVLLYVLLIGLTAPLWFHFDPPRSLASGIAFFTLLPIAGLLLYLMGEVAFASWSDLGRWGRALKVGIWISLPIVVMLFVVIGKRG